MRILNRAESFRKDPEKPLVLALGNFDGIHRGHQRLLDYVVRQAKRIGGRAAVFTFREHPQSILHPGHKPESLQSLQQKLDFFREAGIEVCFLQRFTKKFSSLTAQDFIKKILVQKLGVREICLGYNARFGQGREGDADMLREFGSRLGFEVCQMEPVTLRGTPVSSTLVRESVRRGDMAQAEKFLARPWSARAKVAHGAARGKKLGFPTANMDINGYVSLPYGVYAVAAQTLSKKGAGRRFLKGAANFGVRPTFGKTPKPLLEAYFFDFHGNLYGKQIEVFFLKKLRGEKRFSSPAELKAQIQKDAQAARNFFRKRHKLPGALI